MREFMAVPAENLVRAEGLTADQMALVECFAIGAHATRRAAIRPGEVAAVVGCGPIGLGAIQFASRAGARVIAIDGDTARLDYCKNALGLTNCVNARESDVAEALADLTGGDMPEVIFDATGNANAMEASIGLAAASGRVVFISLILGEIRFNDPDFHRRELTLMGSRNATLADFANVIAAKREGGIETKKFVTHRFAFAGGADGISQIAKPGSGAIKAIISMEGASAPPS
jgi:threonine dehydrogenase-like Zn-dependent dehydrogenase